MRMPCVETISNSCQGCLITWTRFSKRDTGLETMYFDITKQTELSHLVYRKGSSEVPPSEPMWYKRIQFYSICMNYYYHLQSVSFYLQSTIFLTILPFHPPTLQYGLCYNRWWSADLLRSARPGRSYPCLGLWVYGHCQYLATSDLPTWRQLPMHCLR